MGIRVATKADMGELDRVYDYARSFMRAHGNPDQWTDGYPTLEMLESDIARKELYVVEEDGAIHASFMLTLKPEPIYEVIDGAWLADVPYATIHRIATDGQVHGVLKRAVSMGLEQAGSVRIDTHSDNSVMQNALVKLGFSYCGIVVYPDVGTRLAYQLIREMPSRQRY